MMPPSLGMQVGMSPSSQTAVGPVGLWNWNSRFPRKWIPVDNGWHVFIFFQELFEAVLILFVGTADLKAGKYLS